MFVDRISELATADIDDLDAALAAAKLARDAAEAEIAAIVAVVDSRQLFQEHSHSSVKAYLKQQLNCSGADALRIKRRARLFNQHPEIADAFGASHVAGGQIDAMAKAAQHPRAGVRFGEFAELFLDHAVRLEHDDFAKAVQHFIVTGDPDGAFNDQKFHKAQRCASVRIDDGAVSVHASGGDPVRAAEMKRIFDDAVEVEVRKDVDTRRAVHGDDAPSQPMPRTADQRKFDAMYEIFMRSVEAPADGKRPEPLVNIVIDPATGLDVLAKHGFLDLDTDDLDRLDCVDPTTRRCATSTGVGPPP